MKTSPQRKYPKEFSELAVGLAREEESTIPEAARVLSLSDQTPPGRENTRPPDMDLEAEVIRLKRELAEARKQCDILKCTVAYFAKAQPPDTRF